MEIFDIDSGSNTIGKILIILCVRFYLERIYCYYICVHVKLLYPKGFIACLQPHNLDKDLSLLCGVQNTHKNRLRIFRTQNTLQVTTSSNVELIQLHKFSVRDIPLNCTHSYSSGYVSLKDLLQSKSLYIYY